MKLYTRTGDGGDTALFGGSRRPKDDLRIEAYGTLDELLTATGLALAFLGAVEGGGAEVGALSDELVALQDDCFAVATELACVPPQQPKRQLAEARVGVLEACIDRWEAELPPLRSFIRPGGSPAGVALHLARTICRRAERRLVQLNRIEPVRPVLIAYLNRLSDYLFVAARGANRAAGEPETEFALK